MDEETDRIQECRGGFGNVIRGGLAQYGEPADDVQIAQSAGVLLDVGFQVIDSIGELVAARAGHAAKLIHQDGPLAMKELGQLGFQTAMTCTVAAQEAMVQHADGQLQIALMQFQAILHRVNGLAHPQTGIPQGFQEFRDRLALFLRFVRSRVQQQKIDVGIGKQLAAPVSAYGDNCHRRPNVLECGGDDPVDVIGPAEEFLAPALRRPDQHRRGHSLRELRSRGELCLSSYVRCQSAPSPRSSLRIRIASATS
jgi:hypothetical protein